MPAKTKTKRKKHVSPVQLVIKAAQEAEAMRHETYSIQLLNKLAEHNRTKLVPALTLLMDWALQLQKETNALNKKLIRHAKKKGGKRVPKSS